MGTLVAQLRRERLRRRLLAGGLTAGMLLLAVTGWWALGRPGFSVAQRSGVRCRQVRERLPEYLAGKLNIEWTESIAAHLDRCERCRLWAEHGGEPPAEEASPEPRQDAAADDGEPDSVSPLLAIM